MLNDVDERIAELRRQGVVVMDVSQETSKAQGKVERRLAELEQEGVQVVEVTEEMMVGVGKHKEPLPEGWPWRSSPKGLARRQNHRAAEFNAGVVTADELVELVATYKGKCANCGSTEDLNVDHIRPLALGGKHERKNLQLLCVSCNGMKGAGVFKYAVPTT